MEGGGGTGGDGGGGGDDTPRQMEAYDARGVVLARLPAVLKKAFPADVRQYWWSPGPEKALPHGMFSAVAAVWHSASVVISEYPAWAQY